MSVIDMRVGDTNKITSTVKSWIYQPQLVKPQESLLYRDIKEGGLGLLNDMASAKANLIASFCQSALGKKGELNQYHHNIFRYYDLGDKINNPSKPPWYSNSFFETIKNALKEKIMIYELKTSYKK